MYKEYVHESYQNLLLAADGELPIRRAAQVREHLASCWECRTRMTEIEKTIADFVRASRQGLDSQIPPIEGPRALLKAQLAELGPAYRASTWPHLSFAASWLGLAYAFALIVIALTGVGIQRAHSARLRFDSPIHVYASALPNPSLTPGSTLPTSLANICSADHDEVIKAVPASVRQAVFKEYGIAGAPASDYEVDYLITPGLGGSGNIRNLWPEPHYDTVWNSYVKDHLEDHLHYLVCSRQISLLTAQQDMANNWIAAYEKYFHTNKPLADYSTTLSATSGFSPEDMPPTARYPGPDINRNGSLTPAQTRNSTPQQGLLDDYSFTFLVSLVFLVFATKPFRFRRSLVARKNQVYFTAIRCNPSVFEVPVR